VEIRQAGEILIAIGAIQNCIKKTARQSLLTANAIVSTRVFGNKKRQKQHSNSDAFIWNVFVLL